MDALHRVQLRIVPARSVKPHERADPVRQQRIEGRLRQDGVLRDPVMVGAVPNVEGYVLLDGTNRQQALGRLGLPWLLVQVLDYTDPHAVQLQTWCHAVSMPVEELLAGAGSIPAATPVRLSPLEASDALSDPATLAVLLGAGERWALRRQTGQGVDRASQLRALVDLYEEGMVRVDCDAEDVEEQAKTWSERSGHAVTLTAFPGFRRSQVVCMAMDGTPIPAGITRHTILVGRALRVNVPLALLESSNTVEEANAQLQRHLISLQPRIYREPTVLYDS